MAVRPELERRLAVLVEPLERAVLDGVREREAERGRVRVELGLIPVFVDERPLLGLGGLLDWRSSGRLSAILRSGFFSGSAAEQLLTPGERRWPTERLVLVGVGSRSGFDEKGARRLASRCVEIATGLAAETVLIALPCVPIDRGLVEVAFESLLGAIERSSIAPSPETRVLSLRPQPDSAEPQADGAALESQPSVEPASVRDEPRWWVVADAAVVARLRRVRSGPPRAARGGPSLYT
jgi:hypothetical protein